MELVWDFCIAISKKFIMALNRQSTTVDFKEYTPEYKKEQSDIDHLLGFKCEVMVINDENVNVACLPGGKIVVFTELKTFAVVQEIDMNVKKKIMMWKVDKKMEVWWDSEELHYVA
uniref:Peptidase M48 n=1 Tax=Tanacetum cinerariifolium TaxID=118510 RepID=A0A6L2J0C8_TANCI|nr:peptidase M48 [Tanacetum cinerariifolium]